MNAQQPGLTSLAAQTEKTLAAGKQMSNISVNKMAIARFFKQAVNNNGFSHKGIKAILETHPDTRIDNLQVYIYEFGP